VIFHSYVNVYQRVPSVSPAARRYKVSVVKYMENTNQ
jgi:hypothetical protein